jgi:integrase
MTTTTTVSGTRRQLRRKLMPAFVEAVKEPGLYTDTVRRGLVLKVTEGGAKRYAVRYWTGGRGRFYTLGDASALTLAKARKAAKGILSRVELGADPLEERKRSRRAGTVKELAEEWLKSDDAKGWRPRTEQGFKSYVLGDIIPGLGALKVPDVTRRDIRRLVRSKGQADKRGRSRHTAANRLFEVLRMLFRYAVREEDYDLHHSPCDGLEKLFEDPVRQRTYSGDEVRAIFAAVPKTELADLVPLLFHTGTRSEETRAMKWADLDLDAGEWRIPAEDAKTGAPRTMALSSGAVAILKAIKERKVTKLSPYVFPAATAAGYMDQPGAAVARLRRPVKKGRPAAPRLPADFRLHDIRRTVAEEMSKAGERPEVVGAVLGHLLPKIDRTYRISVPLKDQREAVERWSGRLATMLQHAAGIQS